MIFTEVKDNRNRRPLGAEKCWNMIKGHMVAEVRRGIGLDKVQIDGMNVNRPWDYKRVCQMLRNGEDIPMFEEKE